MATESNLPDPAEAKEFFKKKMQFTTGPVELNHMLKENGKVNVVDVRDAEDYEKGHVPGAINLPRDKWSTFEGLQKNRVNAVYCYTQTCHLAANAAVQFASNGYHVMEMEGGFAAWKAADLKVEK